MVEAEPTPRESLPAAFNILVLLISGLASAGSLYLSIGLGLKACPLCFYQRSFAIAAFLAAGMLIWLDGIRSPRVCLTVLSLAASGLGVAGFHVYLVQAGKLECPPALFGLGDGPLQSLAMFAVLTIVCLVGGAKTPSDSGASRLPTAFGAIVVGGLMAWGCIAGAPPLPPAPAQPYGPDKPFDMCRPPYRENGV